MGGSRHITMFHGDRICCVHRWIPIGLGNHTNCYLQKVFILFSFSSIQYFKLIKLLVNYGTGIFFNAEMSGQADGSPGVKGY